MIRHVAVLTLLLATFASVQADEKFALLVGVTKYRHSRMNDTQLQYPEADAKAVASELRKSGYSVTMLLGPKATKANIQAELARISTIGSDGGVCVVGLFGHGTQYGNDAYFGPYDTGLRFVTDSAGNRLRDRDGSAKMEPNPESMTPMRAILDALSLCGASNRVLLADCCREDPSAARGRAFGSKLKMSDLPSGMAALFACSANERAFEHKDWGHGAFTMTLLEAMRSADSDITANSLSVALYRGVTERVRDKTNGRETQTVKPIINGIIDLKLIPQKGTAPKNDYNSVGLKMVRIQPGRFRMGSYESAAGVAAAYPGEEASTFANEHPLRTVQIYSPFRISTTEVTYGQFAKFVEETGYQTLSESGRLGEAATAVGFDRNDTWRRPEGMTPQNNHPVTMVTYHDAQAFCRWLSRKEGKTYRLPTDEEWEYAARAGTSTRYWNGNDTRRLTQVANIPDASLSRRGTEGYRDPKTLGGAYTDADDGFAGVAPVGSFPANPWGLHDVHGNVWEWCTVVDLGSLKINDTRDIAVIRGGCFY